MDIFFCFLLNAQGCTSNFFPYGRKYLRLIRTRRQTIAGPFGKGRKPHKLIPAKIKKGVVVLLSIICIFAAEIEKMRRGRAVPSFCSDIQKRNTI
jgi:hypothetical protein